MLFDDFLKVYKKLNFPMINISEALYFRGGLRKKLKGGCLASL